MSLRKLAEKNDMARTTVQNRLYKGMDEIDALITPPDHAKHNRKVTNQQVIDASKLGMSINNGAYYLGITTGSLRERIARLQLTWLGKGKPLPKQKL